ncbi:MAG: transporter substrate-binding domain-containing protein [Cyclobacteriaceae bacterium]
MQFREAISISVILISLLLGCRNTSSVDQRVPEKTAPKEEIVDFDFRKIKERGYIIAIMDNSSTGLFIYKGKTMGYEYELLQRFAELHDLELRINVTSSLEEGFNQLNRGEGDVLAYNLTVTKERQKRIDFTAYHNLVSQVLIQRKPKNWRGMKLHEIEKSLIRNPIDLIGKKVHVRHHSAYLERLENLSNEIGGDIIIIEEFPSLETESIIQRVANGQYDYTVAEEDVALVNAMYYNNLDVNMQISLPQQLAWGVRKNADSLLLELDDWILKMRKTVEYHVIYDKYFKSRKRSLVRSQSKYNSLSGGEISPYDDMIKESAAQLDWDWRLLAAQIYRESKFNPEAKSWAGAVGLMQIMPKSAEEYGVVDLLSPERNIYAGTQHLLWLKEYWSKKIDDPNERLKFVLGSYNVGHGHVNDAIKLAVKYGKDPQLWDEVIAEMLILKSKPKYYTDPIVEFGYCRGTEPVDYVKRVLSYYDNYKAIFPDPELMDSKLSENTLP